MHSVITTAATPRMNRLFAADGKCLDIAIDHGTFGIGHFLSGIEDIGATIRTLVDAGPDAIQLSPGQAPLLQALHERGKPALVVRTDVGNFYASRPERVLFSSVIDGAVDRAVRLDAACVVVNLLALPDQPELFRDSARNVSIVRAACDQVGMPLMVEPLAMQPGAEGYAVDGDVERIVPLVRQAVELGADLIKADPTDEPRDYPAVLEAAGGRPLLVRGGGRVPVRVALERTKAFMDQGVSGIVYGRNITQHADPVGMTRALMSIVHDGATVDAALAMVKVT